MRIAYLITAYDHEREFRWLFNAIYHQQDIFAIHIDKKTPEDSYQLFRAITADRPNVQFMPRISVVWGGWGLSQVALDGMKLLLDSDPNWTHFINLSGQDYPLRPPDHIREELCRNDQAIYVRAQYIDTLPPRLKRHFRRRTSWFCFEWRNRFIRTPIPLPKPRKFRVDWKGVFWCILPREFCQWIVSSDFARECSSFLRHVKIPDELIMPALVMNSPFKGAMTFDDKREVIWTGKPHPKILTMDDHDRLLNSDAFFARKFDENVDRHILFALARRIGAEPVS